MSGTSGSSHAAAGKQLSGQRPSRKDHDDHHGACCDDDSAHAGVDGLSLLGIMMSTWDDEQDDEDDKDHENVRMLLLLLLC